ncbi:MAG TPA: glycosyltransferase [Gaiellaceae bacterium]|nr:glycosyltransferase [Gaiellaceae bacterium]
MTRLVFATQVVDPDDPVLGPTAAKVRALAARVDELVVLAERIDEDGLPGNCRAVVVDAPLRALRGARFVTGIASAVARRPLGVIAHMSPIYALLAAPIAKPLRVPVALWFTQQAGGPLLARAVRAADVVLTVDARTVPLRSAKIRPVGHGIDVSALPCIPDRAPPLRRLLGLGRYAPVKRWDVAIRALTELPDATLELHGPMLTAADRAHRPELEHLAAELGVANRVTFGEAVRHRDVPELLVRADAVVNATAGSSADKVVYEAAASCLPVFAASPVFDELLTEDLRFDGSAGDLARRVREYSPGQGGALRQRVLTEHSVDGWAERVLAAIAR